MTARALWMGTTLALAAAASGAQQPANPELPPPQRGLLPSMRIAEPAGWASAGPPCRQAGRSSPSPPT